MTVKLPKTSSVVLASDVVYLEENLDKNLIPPIPTDREVRATPIAAISASAGPQHQQRAIFYGHDPEIFKASKEAPILRLILTGADISSRSVLTGLRRTADLTRQLTAVSATAFSTLYDHSRPSPRRRAKVLRPARRLSTIRRSASANVTAR